VTKAIAIAVVAVLAIPARADDKAAAQVAFDRAKALSSEGKWAEACPFFEASYRAAPAIGALINAANCHEHVGRTATAWAEFQEVARMGERLGDATREAFAKSREDALAPKLIRLKILAPKEPIAGLLVTRDAIDVTAFLGSEVPVDPGDHVVTASAPGFIDYKTTVKAATEGTTIEAPLPTLVPKPVDVKSVDVVATPEPIPPIEYDRSEQRRRRTISTKVIVGGSVTLGVGLVLGGIARKFSADSERFCTQDGTCSPPGADKLRTARNLAHGADIAVPLGLVGLVTGIVMWVKAPNPVAISTGLRIIPTTTGAAITGSF